MVDDAINDANNALNYGVYEVSEVYDAIDDEVGFVANDEINNVINHVIDR